MTTTTTKIDLRTAKRLAKQVVRENPGRANEVCKYVTEDRETGALVPNCIAAQIVAAAGVSATELAEFDKITDNWFHQIAPKIPGVTFTPRAVDWIRAVQNSADNYPNTPWSTVLDWQRFPR